MIQIGGYYLKDILYASNLSFNIDTQDIVIFFEAVGNVIGVNFYTNKNGEFDGLVLVHFAYADKANKTLKLKGNRLINFPFICGVLRTI